MARASISKCGPREAGAGSSASRSAAEPSFASLGNLDELPETGAVTIAALLKIVDGSGSPLRVITLAPA